MAPKELPDADFLRKALRYERKTGLLFWRRRPEDHFPNVIVAASWNARWPGKAAFDCIHRASGYKHGKIDGANYKAHRIIWKLVHGCDPIGIDHINGNKADNRLENLREATQAENCKNMGFSKANKSGHIGVAWSRRRRKWVAHIRSRHIGYYCSKAEAIAARKAAEALLGFHPNHGKRRAG